MWVLVDFLAFFIVWHDMTRKKIREIPYPFILNFVLGIKSDGGNLFFCAMTDGPCLKNHQF